MSLLKELINELNVGPSGISSMALAANAGVAKNAANAKDSMAMKKKKKLRKKTQANLHRIVDEDAVAGSTSGHDIAGVRGSLFGGGTVDMAEVNRRRERIMQKLGYRFIKEDGKMGGMSLAKETDFNPSDVISKLDAAEKKADTEKDTVTFGMEDEDGNMVKVYVKADQADEFELALSQLLAGEDSDGDDENTQTEIAEVLFQLKDKFEIIDVEWGEIPQDEEEEQELEGAGSDPGAEGGEGGEGDLDMDAAEQGAEGDLEGGEGDLEGDGELDAGDTEEDAKSALTQVIDMMKADAEAKTAEAEAKKAEAKAKEAEAMARQSASKVQQEEAVLDMEAAEETKGREDKESKQLAKLAKYQHGLDKDVSATKVSVSDESAPAVPDEEEEEDEINPDKDLTQAELAELIFRQLRGEK